MVQEPSSEGKRGKGQPVENDIRIVAMDQAKAIAKKHGRDGWQLVSICPHPTERHLVLGFVRVPDEPEPPEPDPNEPEHVCATCRHMQMPTFSGKFRVPYCKVAKERGRKEGCAIFTDPSETECFILPPAWAGN